MTFESFADAHWTILWLGFAVAFVMGAVVNKTNFCTMGSVSDMVNMGDSGRFRSWVLAIAVAMLGVAIIEGIGLISVDQTVPPYRASNFAWLEYVLGGVLFGIGMTYGSGCGSKTLIRIGGGNIKSIIVFVAIAICAYFMLNPFPGSDQTIYSLIFYPWTNPTSVSLASQQDLGSLLGRVFGSGADVTRVVVGLLLVAFLAWVLFKSADFRKSFDNILGGAVVGLAVLAAWYVTDAAVIDVGGETFTWSGYAEPNNWSFMESGQPPRSVGTQSYTFINPVGQTLGYASEGFASRYLTFGVMAVFGVILGSLFWAIISRGFRVEWFVNFRDFINHVIGGALMGIGGVLALGCTVGQGITGISTLALGSFLAFGGIVLGSAMTMKIQYYKMVYEDEASFTKAFVTALVDFRLLPGSMRKLDAI
ncbi:MAG: YeeE/YedE family protein [Thiohalophilus sp.]|uniref:YeeE/YedE family protein n=1 Tax=Thiohalophilus sp. TaxID=3028392 RepID=UPI00286FCE82|nr:YeeE/YedE family protein [Thiohalophilus sp.]MDR9437270.1 YeeE/YedE family protein [Thiohalophilus sp.]